MKKIIIGLIAILGLVTSNLAHAETVYGFLDGNFYDSNQSLKYICFLDGACLGSDNKVYSAVDLGIVLAGSNSQFSTVPTTRTEAPTPQTIGVCDACGTITIK